MIQCWCWWVELGWDRKVALSWKYIKKTYVKLLCKCNRWILLLKAAIDELYQTYQRFIFHRVYSFHWEYFAITSGRILAKVFTKIEGKLSVLSFILNFSCHHRKLPCFAYFCSGSSHRLQPALLKPETCLKLTQISFTLKRLLNTMRCMKAINAETLTFAVLSSWGLWIKKVCQAYMRNVNRKETKHIFELFSIRLDIYCSPHMVS